MPENIYPVAMNRFFELPEKVREVLAKSAEFSDGSSPLGVALASLPGWKTVVTGTEVRPTTDAGVIWFDTRVDQSVAPTNMLYIDLWITGSVVSPPDTEDPTVPTNLVSSAITDTSFTVTWDAGTDDVGVVGYNIRVNGGSAVEVAATPRTRNFTGLTAETEYTVEIQSLDAADNVSAYVSIMVTTDEAPVETVTYSIDEGAAPTGSWTLGTDGTPYIVFGRGFYKFDSSDPTNGLPTGRVVGADVWIPVGATGIPTEVTFYLFGADADLASTPVQTKVVSLAGATAGDWYGGNFDTPVAFGADGEVRMVAAQFTGVSDAGKYVFGTDTRPSSNRVESLSGKNFAWIEQSGAIAALSSQFRIETGSVVTPSEQTHSYGIGIRVDAGA
jgi:hypothetical protein